LVRHLGVIGLVYLGKASSPPSIDEQSISEAVADGLKDALSALVEDPLTGELSFAEVEPDMGPDQTFQPEFVEEPPPPAIDSSQSDGSEFITSTSQKGGAFPLLALGLVALLNN